MATGEIAEPFSPSDKQLKEAQEAVSQFDFIRFTIVDMNGVPRGVLLPSDVAAKSLKTGIGCSTGKSLSQLCYLIFCC